MKINPSALVSEFRGKLNGSVASRNKGGSFLRNKVTPINPSTSFQTLQRSYQSDLSKAWSGTLTDNQRAAWKSFGQQISASNIFGNNMILSGIATYLRINRIVLNAGGTRIDDPPSSLDVPGILSLALTANHTGPVLTIAFAPSPLVAPQGLYIFATPALSPGIGNFSNRLRFLNFYSAATTPLSIATDWVARFGTLTSATGLRIGIAVQIVDDTTGAISAAATTSTLVV